MIDPNTVLISPDDPPPAEAQYLPDLRGVSHLLGVCPLPDAEGIAGMVALYKSKFKRDITEEEAEAVLRRIIRFIWAVNLTYDYGGKEASDK